MRGQILEVNTPAPDRVMQVLQAARGELSLIDVALYGAQLHVVIADARAGKVQLQDYLDREGIPVTAIEWIAPTLEDVFISSVKPREE